MKTNFIKLLFVAFVSVSLFSCKDKAKEAETSAAEAVIEAAPEATTYNADLSASKIAWKGFKPTGEHYGYISLTEGVLNTTDGEIAGGSFTIDMKSIMVTDIPAEEKGNAKLVSHLSNEDFFDVEKYPTATFKITGIEKQEGKTLLSGNLTLKEATNNVTFPVTVTNTGDVLTLESETFTIDRTKWNVEYGSKSIFDNLGDKFINDDIELKVSLKASKS
ncbi:YceI family protein [Neotamlana laminarinivorans]|uniref:YceI family protein n=1 Tax=Neotamlana laminarinivorans TaxID=2883124 RepID=A0A9X1L1P2_9FLAO|nr:YceI family protein [Tamlana laminarinivorans]MCB4798928.1 YceI family protein [Tamlana laminarinivorans]